jgi:4-aminobutyrate aminotransferase
MDRTTAEPAVSSMPDSRAREWTEFHHESAATSSDVYDFVWDHTRPADGPFCTDVDGNVLLDFTSHVGAAPLGYNNPELLDRMAEFSLVDPLKIAGQDFYTVSGPLGDHPYPGPADLMDRITGVTEHYDLDTVFLSNSGAEAVENAIKIAYDHTNGAYGVTTEGAFHGRTLGALSLNRSKAEHRRNYPEIASVSTAPFCTDRTCSRDDCECGFFAGESSMLRRMLADDTGHVDPDEVAYVIVEPIQGEGGYRIPSDEFMDEVADVCETYDLTLVADEIQAGIGRTGEMWAADHYAIEPDIITAAKGLRVGATISRRDVFPDEEGRISSTWGAGDIVATMQGAITLDLIEEQDMMQNAVRRGRQFQELIRDIDSDGIENVRGKGLMLAITLDCRARRDAVVQEAMQRGFLTLGCGTRSIRFLPPLDVTEREIELGADYLRAALDATSQYSPG